jgi:LPXTG-motif cell wall-anchored protein
MTPTRRRYLAGAAALAAAAIGIGAAAPAASAEEAPYEFQVGASSEGEYWLAGGAAAGEPQPGYFYANPLFDGDETIADFRATLSVPSEYGIALSTDDENCVADGDALICDYTDTSWGAEVAFDLVHDGAIAVGEEVEYTVSVTADDYDTEYFTDTWTFSNESGGDSPEYEVEATSYTEVEPGAEMTPEVAFSNTSSDSYKGLYFTVGADEEFLSIAAEYGNCGTVEWGYVVCHLPEFTAEPGVVYELDASTPVTVTLSDAAPGPMTYRTWFSAQPDYFYTEEIEFFDADEEIAFVESDRESVEGWGLMEVTTVEHHYDLAVEDQAVAADATTLTVPLDNLGPAAAFARYHPGSGEGAFKLSIQLPTGVTVGETDEGALWSEDFYHCSVPAQTEFEERLDPADYGVGRLDVVCWIDVTLDADTALEIEVPIIVADNASADDGLVVANLDTAGWDFSEFEENWPGLSEEDYPVLDADLDNNTAALTLNGSGGGGKLPSTGASLTVTVSAAAAALAAGVVLFVLIRRRKAAADW